jgi:hypothetical protein
MTNSHTLYKAVPNQESLDDNSRQETPSDTKTSRMRKREGVRQYSVYLQESIHREAKIALLMQGAKQDFSGLVEELLTQYLAKQRGKRIST